RCFAMGLHPLKARPSGQLLKANLSPLEGPLHTLPVVGQNTSRKIPTAIVSPAAVRNNSDPFIMATATT
ncbi:hypothetical protein ABIC08_006868, partial [Bradyrhizobium sp. RT9b]|uniref:hypothetical protein n=1 Tax=unclassified Bradyrhizobium TaxID=2631580 RepID=UPI0033988805